VSYLILCVKNVSSSSAHVDFFHPTLPLKHMIYTASLTNAWCRLPSHSRQVEHSTVALAPYFDHMAAAFMQGTVSSIGIAITIITNLMVMNPASHAFTVLEVEPHANMSGLGSIPTQMNMESLCGSLVVQIAPGHVAALPM
jgi:hypothetical protein